MFGNIGNQRIVTASVASGDTTSEAIFIQGANRVFIGLPAFGTLLGTTTANVYCQAAIATGTGKDIAPGEAFRRLQIDFIASAASGLIDWEVPSTTGNRLVFCSPAAGFDFIKIELSTAATDGISLEAQIIT